MEKENILQFDTGYAWIVMLACMCNTATIEGISSSFGILLVELVPHFNSDKSTVSLIGSTYYGIMCLLAPVSGALVNKYGCRIVCMIGSLITCVGLILCSFSNSLSMLTFSFGIIGGIGAGMISLPSIICVSFYFQKRRALAIGVTLCGCGLGTSTLPPLVALLIEQYGWQNAMLLEGAIMLHVLVFSSFLKPNEPTTIKSNNNEDIPDIITIATTKDSGDEDEQNKINGNFDKPFLSQPLFMESNKEETNYSLNPLYQKDIFYSRSVCKLNKSLASLEPTVLFASMTVIPDKQHKININNNKNDYFKNKFQNALKLMTGLEILKNPSYLLAWIGNFCLCLAFRVPLSFVPDYANEMGIKESQAAWLNTAYGVCDIIGRIGFGWFGGLPNTSVHMITVSALMVASLLIGLLPLCNNYVTLVIPYSLAAISLAAVGSLITEMLCEIVGIKYLTNAYGLAVFAHGFGSFIGPPLAGSLYTNEYGYTLPFLLGGALFFITGCIFATLYVPYFKRHFVKNKDILIVEEVRQ